MTAPEPLGPALAAELGGVWDDYNKRIWLPSGAWIVDSISGNVVVHCPIGRHSDGAAALARRARRLGVA